MTSGPVRYIAWSGLVAIGVALLLLPFAVAAGWTVVFWGLLGWSLMAAIGICEGGWLVRHHGSPGVGFAAVLGACILMRLIAGMVGGLIAATRGMEAIGPYLVGLAAGFLPLQIFEAGWFFRQVRSRL